MKWCGSVCTFDMITICVWVGTTFRFFDSNFHSLIFVFLIFLCGLLGVHIVSFESQGVERRATMEEDRAGGDGVKRNK